MKVIILKDNIVKDVSDGYARNYLLPNKLAIIATPAEISKREKALKESEAKRKKQQQEDKSAIEQLNGKRYTYSVDKIGANNKLFGSVTAKDLAELIGIQKENILIRTPIKSAGDHEIEIKLGQFHTKVKVTITLKNNQP